MGSVREETDILIGYLLEVLGKAPQILDDEGQSLVVTKVLRDQILSLVCKRIEGVENPYKEIPFDSMVGEDFGTLLQNARHFHFEEARKSILDVIKEE